MSGELMPLSEIERLAGRLSYDSLLTLAKVARQAHALREENARLKAQGCEVCGHVRGAQQTGPRSPWYDRCKALESDNAALRAVVEAAKVLMAHQWQHAYADGIGGCQAMSLSDANDLHDALAALAVEGRRGYADSL